MPLSIFLRHSAVPTAFTPWQVAQLKLNTDSPASTCELLYQRSTAFKLIGKIKIIISPGIRLFTDCHFMFMLVTIIMLVEGYP